MVDARTVVTTYQEVTGAAAAQDSDLEETVMNVKVSSNSM